MFELSINNQGLDYIKLFWFTLTAFLWRKVRNKWILTTLDCRFLLVEKKKCFHVILVDKRSPLTNLKSALKESCPSLTLYRKNKFPLAKSFCSWIAEQVSGNFNFSFWTRSTEFDSFYKRILSFIHLHQ